MGQEESRSVTAEVWGSPLHLNQSARQEYVSHLDSALSQFEATEANLVKLEDLWSRIQSLLPSAPTFGAPDGFDALCMSFRRVLSGLPAIVTDCLLEFDEAGQMLLDAAELGDVEAHVTVCRALEHQGRVLREYRFRLQTKRRELVRGRLLTLIEHVDRLLPALNEEVGGLEGNAMAGSERWEEFRNAIREIDTLLGGATRPTRWDDLQRHIHFGMVGDVSDIVRLDWPAVKKSITSVLYSHDDPVPVAAHDLGHIVEAAPAGPATTGLDWHGLSDEDFERLLFVLMSEASGYENPEWLQKTRAPDRGRDLSVTRVEQDTLGTVRRYRTIVQCKHWLSKSVGPAEVSEARTQMDLWQPPRVDVLIIATTGRFTADAISVVEQHNQSDRALRIEMWPESHLERLLAARPHLIGQFYLRKGAP